MIRTGLFSIFLLSRLVCAAQDGTSPTYGVQGTVVNAQTNQPIARAEVILNQDYAVLTGNEGRFEFDQIPAGEFQVSVRRPGYIAVGNVNGPSSGRGFSPSPQPARRIRVGPDMPDLSFRLVPNGAIRGQVSLAGSDPADGMRVTAYGRRSRNGRSRWETAGTATTDGEGVFHLGDLAPGNYLLRTEPSVDRAGMISTRGAAPWGYPALYYPGVSDSASAGILTLTAGQTVEADFALTRQTFYPLIAQVRGVDPGTFAGFQILDSSGRAVGLPARYDPRGQVVRANVPNGSWILQGHSSGPGRSPQELSFGRTAFQVTNGPVHVAITVVPVPRLRVTIRREFTSTAEAPSTTRSSAPGVNLQLDNAEPFAQGEMISGLQFDPNADPLSETASGTIDAMPGRYWVEADSWTAAYVRSVTSGGVDLASSPLVISPDSANAPIEVVLRDDFGTISGQITDQAGNESGSSAGAAVGEVRDTYVYAIPLFPTTSTTLSTTFQSPGQFKISQLAPGSYRVVACDSEQEIDFHEPEALAAWAGKGQVVSVERGGTATVQLELLHVEQQP
jgi:hypothetical protein